MQKTAINNLESARVDYNVLFASVVNPFPSAINFSNNAIDEYPDLKQIARYTISHAVGSGGMATVYKAYDFLLKKTVAIKVLHPHLVKTPRMLERFLNEARLASSIINENVISILDYGDDKGKFFIVMEYIDGWSLEELLEKVTVLPPLTLCALAGTIANALWSAHRNKVIHRDIKPANILIARNGSIRIADFGIAHLVNADSLAQTGMLIGSPSYISPEIAEGKPPTPATDVFSFGSMLYRCITGITPFSGETSLSVIKDISENDHTPIFMRKHECILEIAELIDKCLKKNPLERPSTIEICNFFGALSEQFLIKNSSQKIAQFAQTPQEEALRENKFIVDHYISRAYSFFQKGEMTQVLRSLTQAGFFGELSQHERNLSKKAHMLLRINSLKKIAIKVSMVLGFVGLAFFAFRILSAIL